MGSDGLEKKTAHEIAKPAKSHTDSREKPLESHLNRISLTINKCCRCYTICASAAPITWMQGRFCVRAIRSNGLALDAEILDNPWRCRIPAGISRFGRPVCVWHCWRAPHINARHRALAVASKLNRNRHSSYRWCWETGRTQAKATTIVTATTTSAAAAAPTPIQSDEVIQMPCRLAVPLLPRLALFFHDSFCVSRIRNLQRAQKPKAGESAIDRVAAQCT